MIDLINVWLILNGLAFLWVTRAATQRVGCSFT